VSDAPMTLQALHEAYAAVGAFEAEIIYLYSDLRGLGTLAADFPRRGAFCDALMAPFLSAGKTIVMTTFTYTSDGRFDVLSTPTTLGALNKWILAQPGVCRSEHPLFSYAAIGPRADIVTDIGKSAFGHDSVFTRLIGQRAAFLHVGRPVWMGNTALHHVEQLGGATYRVHKAFRTQVFRGDQFVGSDYSAFLRRHDVPGETFTFSFKAAADRLFALGLVRQVGSERDLTNVSLLWYDETLAALHRMFRDDPTIFIDSAFIQY
jgi:aminoglycoside N3'-acetyltransferase